MIWIDIACGLAGLLWLACLVAMLIKISDEKVDK